MRSVTNQFICCAIGWTMQVLSSTSFTLDVLQISTTIDSSYSIYTRRLESLFFSGLLKRMLMISPSVTTKGMIRCRIHTYAASTTLQCHRMSCTSTPVSCTTHCSDDAEYDPACRYMPLRVTAAIFGSLTGSLLTG